MQRFIYVCVSRTKAYNNLLNNSKDDDRSNVNLIIPKVI